MASEMYTHIASTTGSTSSTGVQSITLSSIPQTYEDIELLFTYGVYISGGSGSNQNIGLQWSTSSGGTIAMHNENGWIDQYGTASSYSEVYKHNTSTPAFFTWVPIQSSTVSNPNGASYPQAKYSGILRLNNYANASTLTTWHLRGAAGELNYAVTSSSAGTGARINNNSGYFNNTPSAVHDLKFDSTYSPNYQVFYWLSDLYGITGR